MTPQQYLKRMVLLRMKLDNLFTEYEIDDLYEQAEEESIEGDEYFHDAIYKVRQGEISANDISSAPYDVRGYECKMVAAEVYAKVWVAWPYYYGGGKHGEPSEIDWMDDAIFVDHSIEMQPVHKFKVKI